MHDLGKLLFMSNTPRSCYPEIASIFQILPLSFPLPEPSKGHNLYKTLAHTCVGARGVEPGREGGRREEQLVEQLYPNREHLLQRKSSHLGGEVL